GSTPSYGPTTHPPPRAAGTKDEAINLDASDPDFAASLRKLGAVQPSPTLSHSSAFNANSAASPSTTSSRPTPATNPALVVLENRSRIAAEAEREFADIGRPGRPGRRFMDVVTLRQILMLRDEKGVAPEEIEKHLDLKKGVVAMLGEKQGVVSGV
ncbi:MAG: hypothetical protein M4579_000112, partial [Chaenotheca gracillima]